MKEVIWRWEDYRDIENVTFQHNIDRNNVPIPKSKSKRIPAVNEESEFLVRYGPTFNLLNLK